MKTVNQIQRAHDLLEPVVTGDAPLPAGFSQQEIEVACRTLCWVLDDANASAFAEPLKTFERKMRDLGYVMPEQPQVPFPMTRRPGAG